MMKPALCAALCLLPASALLAHAAPAKTQRPRITGISHISVYDTSGGQAGHFYVDVLGCTKGDDAENSAGTRYYVDAHQWVEVLPLPANAGPNRLDHIAFTTSNAEGMRAYLAANGIKVPDQVATGTDGSAWFRFTDPDGNQVEFVQDAPKPPHVEHAQYKPIGHHVIHVGFVVRDRAAEDHLYKELLGFKPYWYGGMQPDKLDWISQQVPNGTDWLEYMMVAPSATAGMAGLSQNQLGVMNHLSIGVVKMSAAVAAVEPRIDPAFRTDKEPKIGKDGKWQFNMYDPDGTRVELMEYGAVEKPCCSPFTAPNPSPVE
jgi:catechol 2,3-dioxygenase-like lactoylglutathione lyase family enzyme